ncbi:MAG: 50S ribosomal protein L11 methyltransferase [Alicyclobacillaceae bacterium]|nr:50S ribosomal protein L11 methyltransferase [Alicyclobacillaceae bacterium]
MKREGLWTAVEIRTSKEAVEAAAAKMREWGAAGVAWEEVDPLGPDFVPKFGEVYAPGEAPPGGAVVRGYWPGEPGRWSALLADLRDWLDRFPEWGLDPGEGVVRAQEVREEDWANAWKRFYRPVTLRGGGRMLTICPEWERVEPRPGEVVVSIDPGMAFGTGTHETTRLCLGFLLDRVVPGTRVIDVGCGSGILSVAAVKLGAARVTAVDLDPLAVDAARHNAEVAGVAGRVNVRQGDLLAGVEDTADIVVANLLADLVERLLPDVPGRLVPGGLFIASGILTEQEERVCRSVEARGLKVEEVRREGAWSALAAVKGKEDPFRF